MRLVVCPGCGVNRATESLEDERGFARCPDCSAVFVLAKEEPLLGSSPDFHAEVGFARKFREGRIDKPDGCISDLHDVSRDNHPAAGGYRSSADRRDRARDLTVSWRYRHHSPGLVLFLGLVMSFVTLAWVGLAGEKDLPLYLVVALGAPFAMLSMGFLYSFAVATMDWMELRVEGGVARLAAGPLPMPRATVSLETKAISDVYVRKTVVASRAKNRDLQVSAVYFELRVFLDSGEGHRLAQFRDAETALYVSQCLNDALGLEPGPSARLNDKMESFRAFHQKERGRAL